MIPYYKFVSEMRRALLDFEEFWEESMEEDPESYPEVLDTKNHWLEQFEAYMELYR